MTEALYKRLRSLKVRRSEAYKKWLKKKYPGKELHHLIGSMTGIKLNDYLLLPVDRETHLGAEAQKREFCIEHLHESLGLLFEYIRRGA